MEKKITSAGEIDILRTYSPRQYFGENGREYYGRLPNFYAFRGERGEISVTKDGITVKDSVDICQLLFAPVWNNRHPKSLEDACFFRFKSSFFPDLKYGNRSIGDVGVYYLTDLSAIALKSGELPYTSKADTDAVEEIKNIKDGAEIIQKFNPLLSKFRNLPYELILVRNGRQMQFISERSVKYLIQVMDEEKTAFLWKICRKLKEVFAR